MVPTTSELDRTARQARRGRRVPLWVVAIEVALAVAAVLLDLFLPSLVLVALAAVSLLVRREHLTTLGVHRLAHPARSALQILAVMVGWTVLQLALLMPLAEHLTGQRQDVSEFTEIEGNLPLLLTMLALSWTLAAMVEEVAFRGYLLTRLTELFSGGRTTPDTSRSHTEGYAGRTRRALGSRAPLVAAVLVSSALFGLIHTEQGTVGVLLSAVDAVLFCVLRLHYRSLWASVLAHGFGNTIGLTAYFLVGPVFALW